MNVNLPRFEVIWNLPTLVFLSPKVKIRFKGIEYKVWENDIKIAAIITRVISICKKENNPIVTIIGMKWTIMANTPNFWIIVFKINIVSMTQDE